MTYKIAIHSDYGLLKTFKKYHSNESWSFVQEKTQSDFFNDIEAVRYDYINRVAYVSLAFSSTSDSIFVKVCDIMNNNVPIQFNDISKYYDNRDAVVTTTADDWEKNTLNSFNQAIYFFRSRSLWLSGAIMTDSNWATNSQFWYTVQKQLDSGFVEVVSHSRNHLHVPYNYQSEVVGSKEDIVRNLNLPSLSSRNNKEYIYAYVHPFGECNDEIDYTAGNANYLVTRGVYAYHYNFTPWNPLRKIYERMDVACELGPLWGGITDLPTLNSMFDGAVQNKAIYHFYIHPQVIENSNVWNILTQHLNYISLKKNIWYSAFGYLILYHLLQESTILFDPPKIISTPITSITIGQSYIDTLRINSYPNPKYYLNNGPSGMIVDSMSGIINWMPNSLGTFSVEVRAVNNWGSDTLRYHIEVLGIAPMITSIPDTIAVFGLLHMDTVKTNGYPAPKYYLNVAPSGMLIDSISGIIRWTPNSLGTIEVKVRTVNSIGSDTMRYYIKVVRPLLSVKLILESLYDSVGTHMKKTFSSIIPTTSPYAEDPRNIDSIPQNVVDWVLLELRPDAFTLPIYIKSILIDESGYLVTDDGTNNGLVLDAAFGTCFIVVKHRNSITTWSSSRVNFALEHINYDFTSDSSQAYGCNMIKKGNKWCIFSGDVNQDGFVDSTDLILINNNAFNYSSGYLSTDLTGDGFVDMEDLVICDNNAFKSVEVKNPLADIFGKPSNVSDEPGKTNK